MTKQEHERRARLAATMAALGFTDEETAQLRRISATLHRWYELECGNESGSIERDPQTGKPYYISTADQERPRFAVYCLDDTGRETRATSRSFATLADAKQYAATVATGRAATVRALPPRRHPVADREKGAGRRLAAIMARHETLAAYLQTDPRGAPLYILRPGDVPEGKDPSAYYTNGIAVY